MPRWTVADLNAYHARRRADKAALPPEPPRSRKRDKSKLETKFEWLWQEAKGPLLIPQYRFAKPRRWLFDFAEMDSKVAIEIEGGVWQLGRHNRPAGFIKDAVKYLEAAKLGWMVIRLVSSQLNRNEILSIIAIIESRTPPKP